jgi:deaminated glutathione amidase
MRAALLQISSSDDPVANLAMLRPMLAEARAKGADLVLTPEVTNCVSSSRERQNAVLATEETDPVLAGLREEASRLGLWVLAGSLALKVEGEVRFANRSILIRGDGSIAARYDKIHMFDVDVDATETYRESAGFRPGQRAVVADTPWGRIGMTVCYDVRFPHLHRALAKAGARILTVPAAFSPVTGAAHWEVLLRARAIETGAWVIAPAQTGDHRLTTGKPRRTHGHSLVVAPWGEVILDAGTAPGVFIADIDLSASADARRRVPSLLHDAAFGAPDV